MKGWWQIRQVSNHHMMRRTCSSRRSSTSNHEFSKLFQRLESPNNPFPLPTSLLSAFRDYATREAKSGSQSDSYDDLKVEVADYINKSVRLQMKGRSTSEAAYSPKLLDLYDAFVWQFNSPFLWRINEDKCHELYDENISLY
mmetsp:Transcript_40581/g.85184  ORF Transcript_40581/g.85184 Transcript_40581/m.85184 type:complete len:142 (-) Transcript_40581:651-1076(-)